MVDDASAIILRVLEGTASADDVAAEEAFTVFRPRGIGRGSVEGDGIYNGQQPR